MARIRSLLTLGLAMAAVAAPPALGTGWTELPSPANPAGWMGTPSLDAAPDGHAAAAWSGYTGSAFPVVAVAREPGTGWGEPTVLVSGSSVVNPPVIVVDPSGRTVAAWTRCASGTWRVEAAQRPPGGEWGTPVVLATSSCLRTDTQAFATVDAAGHVVLAWTSSEPFRLATASSGPDGTWTTPVSLSPDAVGPSVGLAATGDGGVLAAWTLESGSGAVQVATRDAQARGARRPRSPRRRPPGATRPCPSPGTAAPSSPGSRGDGRTRAPGPPPAPPAPAPATPAPAPTPRSSPRPVATPRGVGPAALPVRRGGVSVGGRSRAARRAAPGG
ncbi:hypothetical protein [Miltoncostaea oceani]|uniref:hypothetical protein n=1 Tax=Miltoncostaea oceani TaxID=2843216 RepID=UPI001C3D5559|nr:hypothetical protein [Miltoncostaea oceani]